MKLIRLPLAIALLGITSYQFYHWITTHTHIFSQLPYPQLTAGFATCIILRKFVSYPYRWLETFIHELIHALFATLFGCRVTAIKVHRDLSGQCQFMDKGMRPWQRTIVRLSPYFFPLLTLLWLLIDLALQHYGYGHKLGTWRPYILSLTLAFHTIMNYHQIHLGQTDFKQEGTLTALCHLASFTIIIIAASLYLLSL